MMNMEDEVEALPNAQEKNAPEMTDEQKAKLAEAMSILSSLADECDCSIEELVENGKEARSEEESGEEESEDESGDTESSDETSEGDDSGAAGKKLALYIAQLKAKRQ